MAAVSKCMICNNFTQGHQQSKDTVTWGQNFHIFLSKQLNETSKFGKEEEMHEKKRCKWEQKQISKH